MNHIYIQKIVSGTLAECCPVKEFELKFEFIYLFWLSHYKEINQQQTYESELQPKKE